MLMPDPTWLGQEQMQSFLQGPDVRRAGRLAAIHQTQGMDQQTSDSRSFLPSPILKRASKLIFMYTKHICFGLLGGIPVYPSTIFWGFWDDGKQKNRNKHTRGWVFGNFAPTQRKNPSLNYAAIALLLRKDAISLCQTDQSLLANRKLCLRKGKRNSLLCPKHFTRWLIYMVLWFQCVLLSKMWYKP